MQVTVRFYPILLDFQNSIAFLERPQASLVCPSTKVQWKPLIVITLGPALFDNNNRLITLSGGCKHLRYLTQFIVTTFYMYKNNKICLKTYVVLPVVCFRLVVPE